MPYFQFSNMKWNVKKHTPLWWTSKILMVPDWRLRESGHLRWNTSSSYMIINLCANYQHSDMERTVSTTPHPILWTLEARDLEDCFIFRVLYHLQIWLSISLLSSTFQHANKCIRNPLSLMLDLDEVDGSWLET